MDKTKIVYNSIENIFGKILVAVNFAKFLEALKRYKRKKTFVKVRRNFMKIFYQVTKVHSADKCYNFRKKNLKI